MRIRPVLELVRVHLTPTAVADSFTGYCLAVALRRSQPCPWTALALAACSVLLYWTGMATNDLLDLEKDRRAAPGRPLARGAIRPGTAAMLSLVLALGALGAALSVSEEAALGAAGVLSLALLYNAGGKRIPLVGNLLMGSCRAGNLLLGALGAMPLASLVERSEVLTAAGVLGLYISWVTMVSVLEDRPAALPSLLSATLPILLFPVLLVHLSGYRPAALANGLLLAALLVGAVLRSARETIESREEPHGDALPAEAGRVRRHPADGFVLRALSGLILVDAGLLLARDLGGPAAALYGLMILAWLWRRRWLQSPP